MTSRSASCVAVLFALSACSPKPEVSVVLTPAEVAVEITGTQHFSAHVEGAETTDVSWTVEEASGGDISDDGTYTAPEVPGTFHVVATSVAQPQARARATVSVRKSPWVEVVPSHAQLFGGAALALRATVLGDASNEVLWSVQEGEAGGTVTSSGEYLAPQAPGTYHLVAKSVKFPLYSAAATVTVLPTPVALVIEPGSTSLQQGQTARFSARMIGTSDARVTWSVSGGATPGSIAADGTYTAPEVPGRYLVVAQSVAEPTQRAGAHVFVASNLLLTPPVAELRPGHTQRFTALEKGAPADVTWSIREGAAGGTISASGLYTAPTTGPGAFHVVARSKINPQDFIESAVYVSANPTSVSGTISYAGSRPGRIYIALMKGTTPVLGTSLDAPGPFTLRGIEWPGTYRLRAFKDVLGTMAPNPAASPEAERVVEFTGAPLTGLQLTLDEPSPGTPSAPMPPSVVPGKGGALVQLPPPGGFGVSPAEHYVLYWSPSGNPGPSNALGQKTVRASPYGFALVDGLTDGQVLSFAIAGVAGGATGPVSPASMPVTIGAPANGSSITGSVVLTNAATAGPVYVLARFPNSASYMGFAKVSDASSTQPYEIQGLSPFPQQLLAFTDVDGDGQLGPGDLTNEYRQMPQLLLKPGPNVAPDIELAGGPSDVVVQVNHERVLRGEEYSIRLSVFAAEKVPVRVALRSAPQTAAVVDLPAVGGRMEVHTLEVELRTEAPAVGDRYEFDVTYADGTTETLAKEVSAVLPLPEAVSPLGTGPTRPTFTWRYNAPLPGTATQLLVAGQNGPGGAWTQAGLASTVRSVLYNADGTAFPPELRAGEWAFWSVTATDEVGNRSSAYFEFTPQ